MSVWHSATTFALAVGLCVTVAQAQSFRNDDGPAEYPPASFEGRHYVDSKGCVYIRAGYAGQVSWVPRVGGDRKVVCGFRPTFAQAAPAPAPAKTVEKPPRAAAPSAVTKNPARAARKPAVAAASERAVRAAPQPAATAAQKRVVRGAQPACPGASALSNQYINDGSKYPVRCGPQQDLPPGTVVKTRPGGSVTGAPAAMVVPKGYEKVWTDDRLNPMRGKGTARGAAQMALVWSDDVPARLIEVPSTAAGATRLSR